MADNENRSPRSLSRRRLLGGGVAALGVAGVGAATGYGIIGNRAEETATGSETVPWRGLHQAGIDTVPPQAHSTFVGLNLQDRVGRDQLIGILKVWTEDIGRLTAGAPALADTEAELALRPARLTVTVGLGPGVFDAIGLPDRRPSWLAPLPAFGIDRLEPEFTGGDLLLQVCSDDPVTVAHAAGTHQERSLVGDDRLDTARIPALAGYRGIGHHDAQSDGAGGRHSQSCGRNYGLRHVGLGRR